MSRNSRQSRRRNVAAERTRQKLWFRRYLRTLSTGVTAVSVGAVSLFAHPAYAATDTWIGNTSANWADAANWSALPVSGASLEFGAAGTAGTSLIDNLTGPSYAFANITFDLNAAAFTINPNGGGNGFTLSSGIANNSGLSLQTINDNIVLNGVNTVTLSSGGGNIALGGALSGAGGLTTTGTGVLTLSGTNTYLGGTILAANTQLNINSSTALGVTAGAFTINGGTIDNTSAGAITVANNNALNINGDFTFTGTQSLNLGSGTVTLGGSGPARTITVNGSNTLGIGSIPTAGSLGLTKQGTGVLTINASNTNVTSRINGTLAVNNGTLNITQSLVATGLTGGGTIALGPQANATRTLTVINNTPQVFTGKLVDGNATQRLSLQLGYDQVGFGSGSVITNSSLTLSGANTFSGQALIYSGTLNITGSLISAVTTLNPFARIGLDPIPTGGVRTPTQAAVNVASGATWTTGLGGDIWIGSADDNTAAAVNSYGYLNNAGTISDGSWLVFARGGGLGVLDQSSPAAVFNVSGNPVSIGSFGGPIAEIHAVANVSGGAFNASSVSPVYVGEGSTGILNISGSAQVNANGGVRVALGNFFSPASGSILNLNGGTLATTSVQGGAGSGAFNLNGGTLKALSSSSNFIGNNGAGTLSVNVFSGGATIDTNGNNDTINTALQAAIGMGVSATGLTVSGSGYIGSPIVTVSGGGGTGATANAVIDSNGNLTGIVITNPGTGYSSAPTFTLSGGGTGATGSIGGAATLIDNTVAPGGLTKAGLGALTLGGANTYAGPTTITGGTLILSSTGSIANTSGIAVNGTGAKLVQASGTAISPTVTVIHGALDGTGTINTVHISDLASNSIANGGNGTVTIATPLTIGNLTLDGSATLAPVVSLATATTAAISTTSVITNATNHSGVITVTPVNTAGGFPNGIYSLLAYSSLNTNSVPVGSAFQLTPPTGLGARQLAALHFGTDVVNTITLAISGNSAVWTGTAGGTDGGNWSTAVQAAPKNWTLSGGGGATDYVSGDAVVFDNTATGTTTVNISTADVTPALMTFNNDGTHPYTINGTGAFKIAGSGGIIMNGAGSVTLNTANTFSGGVTVNAGTLNIGNASAIGTGRLTLGLGTTVNNTSAAAVTLANNNLQTWNGDFSFTGTKDLNLGNGAVTINYNSGNAAEPGDTSTTSPTNSAGTTSTVNVTAGTLTVGGPVSGQLVSLVKRGAGSLVLNGQASYTGTTIIHSGELKTSGGLGTTLQDIQISPDTNDSGTFTVIGGTVNASRIIISGNDNNSLIGGAGPGPGTMNMTAGTVNVRQWFTVGSGTNTGTGTQADTTGTFNISGGTLNINTGTSAAQFEIGNFVNMRGVVNQTGGDINVFNGANGIAMLANGGSLSAVYNMSGGTLNTYSDGGITRGGGQLRLGVNGTGTATFNLTGGTVWVQGVTSLAATTSTFNFDGGTLKAAQANNAFINTIDNFNISQTTANPVTIDDNGVVIGITNNLLHGAFAATDAGINKQGSGTTALSGNNSFNGGIRLNAGTLGINSATALGATGSTLTINAASTSIDNTSGAPVTLTNVNPQIWNFNFAYAGTRDLNMGVGAITMNATRTVTTNMATPGTTLTEGGAIGGAGFGLIKAGLGNLALTGTNTYSGSTTINAGNLSLSGAGSVNGSSGILINGGTLTQNSSTAVTTPVSLNSGTLNGTGTLNSVTVANNIAATLTHGNGTVAPITIGSLVFGGAATINVITSDATRTLPEISTTTVSTNAAGKVVINGSNLPNGIWSTGSYAVLGYTGSIGGAGFGQFQVGQIVGLGTHQTANLSNSGSTVSLVIAGNTLVWTGALDGSWTTATQATPKNWKLSSNGAPTDFFLNDAVSFPDGASTGTVNLTANVAAAAIQFSNATLPYTIQSTGGFGITSGAVFIGGGGSVTMNATNTFTGGTTLSNGTLNLQTAGGLGSGRLTIAGGTIDNTSGSALTLANNIPETWNGNFTFTGSSDLNLGTGPVTLGGSGSSRTVNVANGDLTVGPISGPIGLTLTGSGTLSVDSSDSNNGAQSNMTGELNIAAGAKLQIGSPNSSTPSDFNAGGLTGAGTVENGSTGIPTGTNILERWLILNNAANDVFSGTLQDGPGGVNSRLGLSKSGAGSLTLSGNNSLSGNVTVAGGQLILTGSINPSNGPGTTNSFVNVGTVVNGQNGILSIQGGSMTIPKNTAPSIAIGAGAGTAGRLDISNNGMLTTTSELWLSQGDGGYGVMNVSGGTVNVGSYFAVARGGGVGILNMSGGSLTIFANAFTIGSLGGALGDGIPHGQVNLTGGTIIDNSGATNAGVWVGEQLNGVMNVSGTGQVTSFATEGVTIARNAGVFGNLNLATGGIVTTPTLHPGQLLTSATPTGGTGNLNFHGGTLQANSGDGSNGFNFIPANGIGYAGTLSVYSYKEGANIDTAGNSITIDQPILAPTGNGVSVGSLAASGTGFIGAPAVQILGGGGTGATANAVIDSNGNLTGIVITNPGTGYTSAPSFSLVGGGVNNTGAISGAASLVANTSGGLTVSSTGSSGGTLTLTGVSTYTGPTKITSGTLQLGTNNVINSASSLNLAGGTLNTEGFNQSFSTLKLTGNATIDMSSPQAASEVLNFASSRDVHWVGSHVLTIQNWSNTTTDQIIFPSINSLNANQLNEIQFSGSGSNFAKLVAVTGGFELEPSTTAATGTMKYGDVNQDGVVNAADVSALMAALANLNAYKAGTATYAGTGTLIRPTTAWDNSQLIYVADTNYNDVVDNGDVQALISYIANGGTGGLTAVPEPGSFVLMVLGAVPGVWLAGRGSRRREFRPYWARI